MEPVAAARAGAYRSQDELTTPLSPEEERVIAGAQALLGKAPNARVIVNGRSFVLDCIGTVSAIFYHQHIDVTRDFARHSGNGVRRLHASLRARGALHSELYPRPGDIIFWDNTWDANRDGDLSNDPLTHAGVVMAVDADGTIHYVHSHVRRGVVIEVMNLLRPRDYFDENRKIINHALALGSGISRASNPKHWLSGDLWNSFGDVLRVRAHFLVASEAETTARP